MLRPVPARCHQALRYHRDLRYLQDRYLQDRHRRQGLHHRSPRDHQDRCPEPQVGVMVVGPIARRRDVGGLEREGLIAIGLGGL